MIATEDAAFRPRWWLANAHWQTIYGALAPRAFPGPWAAGAREVQVPLPDGDRLQGVLHPHPDDPGRRRPLVVLWHGLEGSIEAPYMLGMSHKAFQAGLPSLRLNFRNCGGTEHLSHHLYHSGNRDDVRAGLAFAAESLGYEALIPIGVSFGGNLLLATLAELGAAVPPYVRGAVSISAPIELALASRALRQGVNRIYEQYFLRSLALRLRKKVAVSPDGTRLQELVALLRGVRNLYDFDDRVIAPHGGFAGAEDYYARCSAGDRLGEIRCPVLLIHAQDDPFVPFAMYARRRAGWDPGRVATLFPARGGHVGFLAGDGGRDGRWAEAQAIAYAARLAGLTA